jgi:hypothetical protein
VNGRKGPVREAPSALSRSPNNLNVPNQEIIERIFSVEERQAESRLFEIAPHEPEFRRMAIVSFSVRAEDAVRNEATVTRSDRKK